jgi:hypothetical protein
MAVFCYSEMNGRVRSFERYLGPYATLARTYRHFDM